MGRRRRSGGGGSGGGSSSGASKNGLVAQAAALSLRGGEEDDPPGFAKAPPPPTNAWSNGAPNRGGGGRRGSGAAAAAPAGSGSPPGGEEDGPPGVWHVGPPSRKGSTGGAAAVANGGGWSNGGKRGAAAPKPAPGGGARGADLASLERQRQADTLGPGGWGGRSAPTDLPLAPAIAASNGGGPAAAEGTKAASAPQGPSKLAMFDWGPEKQIRDIPEYDEAKLVEAARLVYYQSIGLRDAATRCNVALSDLKYFYNHSAGEYILEHGEDDEGDEFELEYC